MLQALTQFVWEYIVYSIVAIIWWLVLFPIVWLVSLPFILVFALFRHQSYCVSVGDMLASVHYFWYGIGEQTLF